MVKGGKVDFCHSLNLLLPTVSPGLMPKMEFASVGDTTLHSVTALKGSFCIDLLTDPVILRISKPAMLFFFFTQGIIARGKIGLIVMKSSNSFYFSWTDKCSDQSHVKAQVRQHQDCSLVAAVKICSDFWVFWALTVWSPASSVALEKCCKNLLVISQSWCELQFCPGLSWVFFPLFWWPIQPK